jgi:hypothetical protein
MVPRADADPPRVPMTLCRSFEILVLPGVVDAFPFNADKLLSQGPAFQRLGHRLPPPVAIANRGRLDGRDRLPKVTRRKGIPMLSLVLSSDSRVFEPPDLWQTRIDRAFRDRAPRIERIEDGDYVVVERDQILSGIGLISSPTPALGSRLPRPSPPRGSKMCTRVRPQQHLKDMQLDGVAGEVLHCPSSEFLRQRAS